MTDFNGSPQLHLRFYIFTTCSDQIFFYNKKNTWWCTVNAPTSTTLSFNDQQQWTFSGFLVTDLEIHTLSYIYVQQRKKERVKKKQREGKIEDLSERKLPFCHPKTGWPHIPPFLTHHRPGLPLAVSQKKWLKRSLVLKLLSMIAEWEHGAPDQPTHDCGRESLIPRHMTYSPIIPSGSHSTWSKWATSQSVWTGETFKVKVVGTV